MRYLMGAAMLALTAAAPAGAREWSKDKAWTVTEFNQDACLMRRAAGTEAMLQVIETPDHHGSVSVSGLPGMTAAPGPLRYGFTDANYTTMLANRAKAYITESHDSIDSLLWTLGAQPVTLQGRPALEAEISRNFIDLMGSYEHLILAIDDKPTTEGFLDMSGAPAAIAALRRCTAALAAKQPKGAN